MKYVCAGVVKLESDSDENNSITLLSFKISQKFVGNETTCIREFEN